MTERKTSCSGTRAAAPPGTPLLEIDGLSVGYERAGEYTPVLEGVGLTARDGEWKLIEDEVRSSLIPGTAGADRHGA
ncbi:hypothetical protein ACFQVD_27260 [Streptosporangium amethystogenes subsp. fukuiense]|uniref:ABC transporter ATP-binding protein n=1 Tax=Streptosporangium amethystogenes subsp. fukuiense TaxID=698418 RepID=A0ABW2T587_9ACTN